MTRFPIADRHLSIAEILGDFLIPRLPPVFDPVAGFFLTVTKHTEWPRNQLIEEALDLEALGGWNRAVQLILITIAQRTHLPADQWFTKNIL